jgi:glycosyltransferase involved in cell wall biosynthesis
MATCTQFAPDVVHTHGYRADLLAGSAAHRLGLARVSTLHGFTGGDWKNRLYERLQLRQLRHFDAVVSVSEPIAGRLSVLGFSPERVAIVPNAFSQLRAPFSRAEARALLGLPPDKAIVGWVGRLSHEKGADVLLEAMARLHRPDVLTVVVGDGRLRGTLEAQARSLGMMEQVRWPGLVEDAGRCMAAFDAFVLSSRTEGTPIALLEAMASGTPIVATAVGGVPQVVVAGSEALLTPAEDPGALAAAIGEVLDNREAAAQRARAARARLERDFALDPWIERHRTLYQRILARRRGENA